jgi:hypothetical protein
MVATLCRISDIGVSIISSIHPGASVTVGRSERANLAIPEATYLSSLHFSITHLDHGLILRDLGSRNGTFVNAVQVTEQKLVDGDTISAGGCTFRIDISGGTKPLQDPVSVLFAQHDPLFAVLDAARDKAIHPLIIQGGVPYLSLYHGRAAIGLERVAPYLLYLPPGCNLLPQLIDQGWSKSWGIFLTCRHTMDEVRKQFRRSLMVTLQETQQQVYFRFYDPRVIRIFLPIAEPIQLAEFAGPVISFLIEDEDPGIMLRFFQKDGALAIEKIALAT